MILYLHYYLYTIQTLYNDREPQNPQSPCWWALPTLCSGAQINGMTLTGAADPAAGFSGMVRSDEVVMVQGQETFGSFNFSWSGHFCGDFSDHVEMAIQLDAKNIQLNTLQCEMPRSVTAVTVTVTSKEQWISSFASFSRWRPRDIIFRQAQATEHAMNTHRVSFHEWSASQAGRKTAFRLKAGDTMEFRDISWYLPFSRTETFNKVEWWSTMEFRDISHSPSDVLAATCAAGWTSTDSARLKVFLHVTWWPWLDQGLSPSSAPNLVAGWDCNVELCRTGWITADDENSMEPQPTRFEGDSASLIHQGWVGVGTLEAQILGRLNSLGSWSGPQHEAGLVLDHEFELFEFIE